MKYKRQWGRRFMYLWFVKDTEHIRFFLTLSSFLWAAQLFFSPGTFSDNTYMYMIGTEIQWAIAHLMVALLTLYSMLDGINNKWLRRIEPTCAFLIWVTSAVCMTRADFPFSAALSTHIVSALMSWWLLIRIKVD
jgi:hypothetical protein